jgi:hypothetical protein
MVSLTDCDEGGDAPRETEVDMPRERRKRKMGGRMRMRRKRKMGGRRRMRKKRKMGGKLHRTT